MMSARRMRSAPTEYEALLWTILRKKQVGGYKFRRQHIIAGYIVDFYCPAAKLVIEVDGDVHDGQQGYDQERDKLMKVLGYRVLRFKNREIVDELGKVLGVIVDALSNPITNPSPYKGKGDRRAVG